MGYLNEHFYLSSVKIKSVQTLRLGAQRDKTTHSATIATK